MININYILKTFVAALAVTTLAGCVTSAPAPVVDLTKFKPDHSREISDVSPRVSFLANQEQANHHIVKAGETLYSIAWRYSLDHQVLAKLNNVKANTIYPGQKLVVYAPGVSSKKTSSKSKTPTDVSNRDKDYHVIKSGENLGLIANKYNCSVNDLKEWNKISSNTIQPGQKLIVYAPKKNTSSQKTNQNKSSDASYVYHTVRKGDTLWDIAKLYDGVTVDQIKSLNNIRNSKRLKPGQKLKVAYKG